MIIGLGAAVVIMVTSLVFATLSLLLIITGDAKGVFKVLCILMILIGIINVTTMLLSEKLDTEVEYTEYNITKLTLNQAYFKNEKGASNIIPLDSETTIIEHPDKKYKNIIVKEKQHYYRNWIFNMKFRCKSTIYHVYLTQDVYDRLQSGDTIYTSE